MTASSIGLKIKKVREIKGYKQEFMAEKLDISQQSYSNLESGKIDVPFTKLESIAEIFQMRIEDLVSFDEKLVLNNYGSIEGNQYANINNNFPEKLEKLYEDKIKLLEDKIAYLEEALRKFKETE